MSLGLLESKLPAEPVQARPIVREARAELAAALEELRELTQGIHPAILAERGLPRRSRCAVPPGRPSGALQLGPGLPFAPPGGKRGLLRGQRGADDAATLAGQRGPGQSHLRGRTAHRRGGRCRDRRRRSRTARPRGLADSVGRSAERDGSEPARPGHHVARGVAMRVSLPMTPSSCARAWPACSERPLSNRRACSRRRRTAGAGGALRPRCRDRRHRMPPTHTDEGLQAAKAIRQRRPGDRHHGLVAARERPRYALELLSEGTDGVGYLLKERCWTKPSLPPSVRPGRVKAARYLTRWW